MKNLTGALFIILLYTACKFNAADTPKLPIYGNRDTASKVVNGKTVIDSVYQTHSCI
jgi:protein SCO1/2